MGAPAWAKAAEPDGAADAAGASGALSEVVVTAVPYRETVLPTRMSVDSTYGLKLNVLDTPRNTALVSTTQLETLDIHDPRAFSYLTASSYTGSAFGTPNIPMIRGWFADVFINGMRMSFTQNGYGVPLNFDNLENVAITKGPASVINGPGPGVGGAADLLTKRPDMSHTTGSVDATADNLQGRRVNIDFGAPIIAGDLALRLDYSGEDSGSYFYGHYTHRNAVYGALRWAPNDHYQLDFSTELNVQRLTEDVGINRVNQALIDHGNYLTGGPDGTEYFSQLIGVPPIPVANPSSPNPYAPVAPILTEVLLGRAVQLDPRITIDYTPVTSTRAMSYNAQLIQSYTFDSGLKLENNTFFALQNSDNQEGYYYSDNSKGTYSIESRTDLTGDFKLHLGAMAVQNQSVVGFTYRFSHTDYLSDFNEEPLSVYDLTGNHLLWTASGDYQTTWANAYSYKSVFGRQQFAVPGRDSTNSGNDGVSNLWDAAVFFQDRMEFNPQWSVLFGARIDAIQNHTHDPFGGPTCCFGQYFLPQDHTTGVYGLGNGNFSLVYKPRPWLSTYFTFDIDQTTFNNGGEGGVNTYGTAPDQFTPGKVDGVPDRVLLRQTSSLYEAGVKATLLDDALFAGLAVFDQKRPVPTGYSGTAIDRADIAGIDMELNYQPTRKLFATASYSYIRTRLENPYIQYDYPAAPGVNVDGSALFAVFKPGQTFRLPGSPEQIFNALANYKTDIGLGLRAGIQVTGPIQVANSGYLDPVASTLGGLLPLPSNINAANGYYTKSPVIPWQYTLNAAVFYEFGRYTVTASVYNLTDQRNWESAPSLYGNDMLVLENPRTFELRLQAKF
jgi:outer membrane receptor protein involved in Fe transport